MILCPAPKHALQPPPHLIPKPHTPNPTSCVWWSCCDDADILSSYCREINANDVFLAVLMDIFLLFSSEEYVIQIVQRLSERRCWSHGSWVPASAEPRAAEVLRWPVTPQGLAHVWTTSSNGFQECFVTLISLRRKQVHWQHFVGTVCIIVTLIMLVIITLKLIIINNNNNCNNNNNIIIIIILGGS